MITPKPALRIALALTTLLTPSLSHAGLFGNEPQKESQKEPQKESDQKTESTAEKVSGGHFSRPDSFADLAEALIPSVVNISSTVKAPPISETAPTQEELDQQQQDLEEMMPQLPEGSPFQDFFEKFMERQGQGHEENLPISSLGSGFIVDAEKGYIVTNNHVIKDAEEVRVTLHNDETVDAEIIGRDEKTDLAVLKIDPTGKNLTAIAFGDSDIIRVGDWIVAIGNPFGLGGTVTAGIISARARDINSGPYDDYLQTDASINRGNSGGPMFNLSGELIGINTAIFSPTGGSVGIGFAIPSALAKPVISQLIEFGHTRRGWLGVRIQSVTEEIAGSLGLAHARGALIASITKGGPADVAGIEAGDIVLEFNGQEISEMKNLPRIVAETKIDENVKIKVLSKGVEKTLTVKVGELEKAEKEGLLGAAADGFGGAVTGTEVEPLGLMLDTLTDGLREDFATDETLESGVVIMDVKPDSDAAEKGLIAGDVIVEINQAAVKTPEDVQKAVDDAKQKDRKSILLLINRGGEVRFVALKLGEAPAPEKQDSPKPPLADEKPAPETKN